MNGFLLLLLLLLWGTSSTVTAAAASSNKKKKNEAPTELPCQKYLDMSDEDLFFAASDGRMIGDYCRIKHSPKQTATGCEYSVTAEPSKATGYDG